MFKENRRSARPTILGRWRSWWALAMVLSLLIPGCTPVKNTPTQAPFDLGLVFTAANTIPGWTTSQAVQTYGRDNLFNLVDGQADSFFLYGFEKVAVQRYKNDAGVLLNVEIWQLSSPADAYGLFTAGRSDSPVVVGNAGDVDPGRRIAFWQNQYFASLYAAQPVPDETLQSFAQAIAGKLPSGGATPEIVGRLPASGLVEQRTIFFHEEASIQRVVWLGGENILGLSQETNGVVGQYKYGDTTARLLLIEYPSSGQASQALNALQKGSVSQLVASDAKGNRLGAVFGKVDAAQSGSLLQEALK